MTPMRSFMSFVVMPDINVWLTACSKHPVKVGQGRTVFASRDRVVPAPYKFPTIE